MISHTRDVPNSTGTKKEVSWNRLRNEDANDRIDEAEADEIVLTVMLTMLVFTLVVVYFLSR